MITKIFFLSALVCCCMIAGNATAGPLPPLFQGHTSLVRIDSPVSPFRSDVEFNYQPKLQINRSLAFRALVQLDEPSGAEQLRQLCLTSQVEEHWAYLPGLKTWVEIGFDETPGTATIDFDYLFDLMEQHDELVIYHIHLRHYLNNAKKAQQIDIPETWLIVPSFSDIALMIYFTSRFHAMHPNGDIQWKVSSPLGLTTYSLTEDGLKQYQSIEHDAFLLTYFCPGQSESIESQAVPVFHLSAPHCSKDLIKWVNTQCEDRLRITFQPYTGP